MKYFDRRTMLRGMLGGSAVAVGLPLLECMLNESGDAHADGSAIPKRFGRWFFGNGANFHAWAPATTGTGWQVPELLAPLAGVIDDVSVVTRSWVITHSFWAHHTSYKAMMSAAEPGKNGQGYPEFYGGPIITDVIADALHVPGKHRKVEVQVSRAAAGAEYLHGDVASARYNPAALFDLIFSGFVPDETAAPPPVGLLDARRSVLDAVADDARALRKRLSSDDRVRLDAHLQSVASIQQSIVDIAQVTCEVPERPGDRPADLGGNKEPLEEIHNAMADVLVYALACDLTRCVDVMFSNLQSNPVYWQVGINQGHHEFGHAEGGDQPLVRQSVIFQMEQLAYLLDKMRSIPVGAGNLLDHSLIWVCSEQTEALSHSGWSVPTLLVGKAGGALKGGVHVNLGGPNDGNHQSDDPSWRHARALLTMLHALDIPSDGFGHDDSRATEPLDELLTGS